MFMFPTDNNLRSLYQSGFKPGDYGVDQSISIKNNIYNPTDEGLEVKVAFLDIIKIFHKIWQKDFFKKIKYNGVVGDSMSIITEFVNNRKPWVLLNGKNCSWICDEVGISQGYIMGLLFLLIYMNHLAT